MSGKPRRRDTMASELLRLREQIATLFDDHEQEKQELQQQKERAEQERQEELAARQADKARTEKERDQQVFTLLLKMGQGRQFILDILQEGQAADLAVALRDVRDAHAELVRWIQQVSGQRLSRFPTELEAPEGLLTLSFDELADPDRGFEIGNERPFTDGQKQVTFKLIRRGWRLGSQVLHPAKLSAFEVSQAVRAEKEDR